MKTIQNGNFQDPQGNAVTGNLVLLLSQDAKVTAGGQVAPKVVRLTVTAGNVSATSIFFNDELTPSGTAYQARLYDSSGNLIWGPETWVFSGAGPVDLGTMVPTTVGAAFPAPALVNQNNAFTGTNTHSGSETFATLLIDNTLPGITYQKSLVQKWLTFVGGADEWILKDLTNNNNILTVQKGSPLNTLTITAAGFQFAPLMTSYFGLATAGLGLPPILFSLAVTGQGTAVPTTAFGGANQPAGRYRISWYMVTQTVLGNTVALTLGWTDLVQAQTQAQAALGTAVGSFQQGSILVQHAGGANITYAIPTPTTGTFTYYLLVERLA